MKTVTPRYQRGDNHPVDAGSVFHRYRRGEEVWVTLDRLNEIRSAALAVDAVWRKTPAGIAARKEGAKIQNQKPHIKAYRSAYYKRQDVRDRRREAVNESARRFSKTAKGRAIQKRSREKPETKAVRKAFMKGYWPAYHERRYAEDPEYRESCLKDHRAWVKNNREKVNKSERAKYQRDPNYRLAKLLRNRIGAVLRGRAGAVKTFHMEQLVGCSIDALLLHLQSQFT